MEQDRIDLLSRISDLTVRASGNDCAGSNDHVMIPVPVVFYEDIQEKTDLLAQIIGTAA